MTLSAVVAALPVLANAPISKHLSDFHFQWQEQPGTVHTRDRIQINPSVRIKPSDQTPVAINRAAASDLQRRYNIFLDNLNGNWSEQHAHKLLEVLATIPQEMVVADGTTSPNPSYWVLADEFIENDIEVDERKDFVMITISEAAFAHASRAFLSNGNLSNGNLSNGNVSNGNVSKGFVFSQRLHHALVRYVTRNGTRQDAYEKILKTRFGVSSIIDNYASLTANTTRENRAQFQNFHADEIVEIINMFEEMPSAMHKIAGFRNLVRRMDGTSHPVYGSVPAVAWTNAGYIEFTEVAFNTSYLGSLRRLIIHEKSHFLWSNRFDSGLISDWIDLSGWRRDKKDPDGWTTSGHSEFVSAYAHRKTPDEHMAESIAYYIIDPDLLKARALGTHEFIRNRIMQGNHYLSQIREDLTFEVDNLYPDYDLPGRIQSVDIRVSGEREEDKIVTIELELHSGDALISNVSRSSMRIFSQIGTFIDLRLYPIDPEGYRIKLGTRLRGSFRLSRYSKNSYWNTDQIVIIDQAGNRRFQNSNDFGWNLYIDNPLEDLEAPSYIQGTARLGKSSKRIEGRDIQVITATWRVSENVEMGGFECYASLNDEHPETYRRESYGRYEADTQTCRASFDMPDYMPSGTYSLALIRMSDNALNVRSVSFAGDDGEKEALPQISLSTSRPDLSAPVLDLNKIEIDSAPANLESPNGETLVTIKFQVADDISGFDIAAMRLRDPGGLEHFFSYVRSGSNELFYTGEVTAFREFIDTIVIPAGSAPGTWGLSELSVRDNAGNFKRYDFTEIVHFEVL